MSEPWREAFGDEDEIDLIIKEQQRQYDEELEENE